MSLPIDKLTDPHLTIVIAYAPAGLGHIRVSRALFLGLPQDAKPILLPDTALSVRSLHRLASINPLGKRLMEWWQYGIQEEIYAHFYRMILHMDAHHMKQTLYTILKQRVELPKTLLVVATYFGVAHQIAHIKDTLEQQANVKVILVVQVTDDSPQKMWYVPGADCIFVPSYPTKKVLETYARSEGLSASPIVVNPYPVSPVLGQLLSPHAFTRRSHQAIASSDRMINVAIPISGAAVGLSFISDIATTLHRTNNRFHIHLIGKRTVFTELFFRTFERRDYCTSYESHSDRQIVELYEQAYEQTIMLVEITKPSEQAFKALIGPRRRGGAILLFTQPVGRQEYDNLAFLRRHTLIPTEAENKQLYDVWKQKRILPKSILAQAVAWRGMCLPSHAVDAAHFIAWLHKSQLFRSMLRYELPQESEEISQAGGVATFWNHVAHLL